MAITNSYDYQTLYKVFSRNIKSQLGLTMIELNGNGKMPPAPFVAFDIISPRIRNNFLEDDRQFECVVSFTVYAKRKLDALDICNQLRLALANIQSQEIYNENNMVLVEEANPQARYVQETNDFAFMFGFDARLRLWETYQDQPSQIEGINFKEENK